MAFLAQRFQVCLILEQKLVAPERNQPGCGKISANGAQALSVERQRPDRAGATGAGAGGSPGRGDSGTTPGGSTEGVGTESELTDEIFP